MSTTTIPTITVSFLDEASEEIEGAAYFQMEDGWVTFKTPEHKAVAAYPEHRVASIKVAQPSK